MDRRALIKSIAIITGASVVGSEWLMVGCKSPAAKAGLFTPEDVALLDEIAETILPATEIPGAKATQVGSCMALMVEDCYDAVQQQTFVNGLTTLEETCYKTTGMSFLEAGATGRQQFLIDLDQEAKLTSGNGPVHYFTMMKQLAIFGYFTSEIGATQALRYILVPGRYDGCIPYTKGENAWAL